MAQPRCIWCSREGAGVTWEAFNEKVPGLVTSMVKRLYPEACGGEGVVCHHCKDALIRGVTLGIAYAKADLLDVQANSGPIDPSMTLGTRW